MSFKKIDFETMSVDDLWSLHESISKVLSEKITSEKYELERRLAVLNRTGRAAIERPDTPAPVAGEKTRRQYPQVLPKYRNPKVPSETWSGRGKQPRWLVAAMTSGRKIDDFKVKVGEAGGSKGRR
jgi:DNA-binding protein H-NS